MRKLTVVPILVVFFFLASCSSFQKQSIDQFTKDYRSSSDSVRALAQTTSRDWVLGAGLIMGAMSEDQLPSWVYKELINVTTWFISPEIATEFNTDTELNDYQLGYIVGLRFRLFGPIVRGFIELYVPNLLQVAEVASFLMFFGM